MAKKRITVCLRSVGASLLKRVGISGLVGAGIGLAYIPLSFGLICLAYAVQEMGADQLSNIISLPALPFFFFASYMQLPAVPFFVISIVLFTAVGAGIGSGVHWTRNRVKKTRASRG